MPAAKPAFVPLELAGHVGGLEPVLTVRSGDVVKVYPLRILALHGVINDEINAKSVALTYCGPCGTVAAFQTRGQPLGAAMGQDRTAMILTDGKGGRWRQSDGAPQSTRQAMLKALPSTVVSMARARQSIGPDDVVLVLQDTALSRVPTPKTLALPGQTAPTFSDDEDNGSNTTKVLDARSWSLDVLSPERRLGGEERLILLEKRQGNIQGPPAP